MIKMYTNVSTTIAMDIVLLPQVNGASSAQSSQESNGKGSGSGRIAAAGDIKVSEIILKATTSIFQIQ
jgi:hypothetical protein